MKDRVRFYKDIQLIKFCKVPGCNVEYRPARYSFFAHLGLCHSHRSLYYRNWYINTFLPFFAGLSPEGQQKYRDMRYKAWKAWVTKNGTKRRVQALESYHRHKDEHRSRRHRSTAKGTEAVI